MLTGNPLGPDEWGNKCVDQAGGTGPPRPFVRSPSDDGPPAVAVYARSVRQGASSVMPRPSRWVAPDRGMGMVSYAVVNRWLIGRGDDRRVDGQCRNRITARCAGED